MRGRKYDTEMIKYTDKHTIPCYDTDAAWRLKPSSFMNLAQEAAGRHAVDLGFGYDDLIKSNTAWILSRVHIEFVDTPKWRDELTLTTWHKGVNRLFYLRDFILKDAQGNPKVKATTSWLVLNLETRRLVRDPELMEEGTVNPEHVIETPADKVVIPRDVEMEHVMDHVVAYSDGVADCISSKEDLIPVVEMCKETVGVHVEKETRRGRRDV